MTKMRGGILNSLNTLDQNNTEMSEKSSDSIVYESAEDTSSTLFSNKNIIIMILVGLLILSFLGMNIFLFIGMAVQYVVQKVGVVVTTMLGWIGFYTGAAINTTADVVGDTAKAGIDIAEGTVHSVGNLLQDRDNVSGPLPEQLQWNAAIFETHPLDMNTPVTDDVEQDIYEAGNYVEQVGKYAVETAKIPISIQAAPTLDDTINTAPPALREPAPTEPANSWCLVGEYDGRRSCMQVDSPTLCMSGQLYEKQNDCLDIHSKSSPLYKEPVKTSNPQKYVRQAEMELTQNWGIPPPRPPPAAYAPSAYNPPIYTNPIPLVQQPPVQYPSHVMQYPPQVPMNPYNTHASEYNKQSEFCTATSRA
jgi:hypothetical protein